MSTAAKAGNTFSSSDLLSSINTVLPTLFATCVPVPCHSMPPTMLLVQMQADASVVDPASFHLYLITRVDTTPEHAI